MLRIGISGWTYAPSRGVFFPPGLAQRMGLVALILALGLASAAGAEPSKLFTDYDAKSFRELERAQQTIDPEKIDDALLSAAIFHETNARRKKKDFAPLAYKSEVREAAAMQARILAERGVVAHQNPGRRGKETPYDRLQSVGLNPAFAAENVAMVQARDYQPGKPFYTRREDGRVVYSYKPGGKPLAMLTYAAFAAKLLDSWMDSPHHRKNILSPEPKFLGTAARRGAREGSMDEWYGAQVFYTPLTKR